MTELLTIAAIISGMFVLFTTISPLPIIAVVGALCAPLITYLVAVWRFSGRINRSDARELWEESRSIRTWSQERIQDLNNLVSKLEKRVYSLETDNVGLAKENMALSQQVATLNLTITDLNLEIKNLTDELKISRERVLELEAR